MIAGLIRYAVPAGFIACSFLLLTGCQSSTSGSEKEPVTPQELQQVADKQCASAKTEQQESCRYFAQMQYGIQRNFNHADRYSGRECAVTIRWNHNGRYSVLSTAGDENLCLKTWGVVSSAENLPAPPKSLPQTMVIEFKPA